MNNFSIIFNMKVCCVFSLESPSEFLEDIMQAVNERNDMI